METLIGVCCGMYRGYTGYTLYKRRKQRGALAIQLMVLTLALVGGTGYYFSRHDRAPEVAAAAVVQQEAVNNVELEASALPDLEQTTVLEHVGGETGSGKVTRKISRGKTVALFVAELPKTEAGTYYEAWAVQSSPFRFISLGSLVQRADGKFGLVHETNEDLRSYESVVITREKNDRDPSPSAHVLEGKF